MSQEPNHHPIQIEIIQTLLFTNESKFSDIQKMSGLESNQVTFHLKRLIENELIEKTGDKYSLTIDGKEFANRLDTDIGKVEKQPKSSVLLLIPRDRDGKQEFLQQQRLKQPWYGYYVYVTGKIRWGESVYTAAARELYEETGMTGSFRLLAVDHERDLVEETGEILEDKLFYVMLCEEYEGEMVEEFEGGRNQWMTKEEFLSEKNIDGAPRLFDYLENKTVTFKEHEYYFDKSEF